MLLQLDDTDQDDVVKLLAFAKANYLKLSLIDESEDNYLLPGKPLTEEQLTQLITNSRNSGIISMEDAHKIISSSCNAD